MGRMAQLVGLFPVVGMGDHVAYHGLSFPNILQSVQNPGGNQHDKISPFPQDRLHLGPKGGGVRAVVDEAQEHPAAHAGHAVGLVLVLVPALDHARVERGHVHLANGCPHELRVVGAHQLHEGAPLVVVPGQLLDVDAVNGGHLHSGCSSLPIAASRLGTSCWGLRMREIAKAEEQRTDARREVPARCMRSWGRMKERSFLVACAPSRSSPTPLNLKVLSA